MLRVQFSNRIETLRDALVDALGVLPSSPFTTQQVVVPSSAVQRYLTLAIAERHGVCANVDFVYLAQWLWRQIAQVVTTVADESPFAADTLQWRIYQQLRQSDWHAFPRLSHYLKDPNEVMRFELAAEIAALFEQYITYRQDWMGAWVKGDTVAIPKATPAQVDDERWQAELWRRLSGEIDTAAEHPASAFLRSLESTAPKTATPSASSRMLPETVHVFCLPAIPPLYLAVLTGLARWIDVTLYVLNPCREYWFDIVDPKRLAALSLRGAASHHETGNRLLASWGKQTKAHIELLVDRANDAPLDDEGFEERFPLSLLGSLQHAIFSLAELEPAGIVLDAADRSIEIHVCHSLTRELEVLQDQLLALFATATPPQPAEILIVTPDLEAAAPLIEAVFGNVPEERRLPFAITGRGRSAVNPAARALVALLAIVPSRFPASALVELLQQPMIARRFSIDTEELEVIEAWLHDSGIRWGIDKGHRDELDVPGGERFTLRDGLARLFLGYAMPDPLSAPVFGRIPAGNAEGSRAQILGAFAEFVEQLTTLRAGLREPRLPDAWFEALLATLDAFLAPTGEEIDAVAEVRATLRDLHDNMRRGEVTTPVPLAVLRASLQTQFDDAARGGVPGGAITFSSMSSLRNLPFRFIGIVGLNDGAFPAVARPREFDLTQALPRVGDRQRGVDDRNLFLDLMLAARERFYLSYTGRSIRDNSVRPPSVVVAELIETLVLALAQPGDAAAVAQARQHLLIEHPLQAFAEVYFHDGDPRRRSFNRELCAALRHALVQPEPVSHDAAIAKENEAEDDNDDDALENRGGIFFSALLAAPGPEWRHVTLDQLLEFFRNPCHFLLRKRLGMSLYREEDGVLDDEPFVPDFLSRQALAERLLPNAMQGSSVAELRILAQAGIEYPPGGLGSAALDKEIGSLQRFALSVRDAMQSSAPAPLAVNLGMVFEGEDWQLTALIADHRESGPVLHRYDDTRAGDYLAGWLTHLVATAASAAAIETRWISRNGEFRFMDCRDARAILETVVSLYRRGLSEPIHFFPKSAWTYIREGREIAKARKVWRPEFAGARGEERHEAYRLALRGHGDPLDAQFEACAEIVFGSSGTYLLDTRL